MNTKSFIYADNASTTKLDPLALEAMLPFLQESFGNPSSLHSFSTPPKQALLKARKSIANSINALPEEVFFTSGGTESNNWALKSTIDTNKCCGKHIIVSSIEHHAVLNSCKTLGKKGYEVTYLPVTNQGLILPHILEKSIRKDTILISIILANNEIGTIQDIPQLVEIAHKHNITFHTDAIQAVGHIPINVNTLGVDLLSASAHKFNGPKGTGFLYIKKNTPLTAFIDGGQQENGFRAGTENIASIIGMSIALKNNILSMPTTIEHLKVLSDLLKKQLSHSIPNIIFNGTDEKSLPGLISLSIPDVSGEGLLHILDLKRIIVSTGAACDSQKTQISHVLKGINLPSNIAQGTLRISLGKENQVHDINCIVQAILKAITSIL